jgi:hypothetical protein
MVSDTRRNEIAIALHDDWCGCDSYDGANCDTYAEWEFPEAADAVMKVVTPWLPPAVD